MNLEALDSKGLAAFETLYPRLLGVVRERYSLELGKSTPKLDRRTRELLEECVSRFGDTLKAVYSFGLFEELENEMAWLVSVLESRGRWSSKKSAAGASTSSSRSSRAPMSRPWPRTSARSFPPRAVVLVTRDPRVFSFADHLLKIENGAVVYDSKPGRQGGFVS